MIIKQTKTLTRKTYGEYFRMRVLKLMFKFRKKEASEKKTDKLIEKKTTNNTKIKIEEMRGEKNINIFLIQKILFCRLVY